MPPDLAFNTAMSFTTNTDWQSCVPELAVSYFSNMVALASHNWTSAAGPGYDAGASGEPGVNVLKLNLALDRQTPVQP
jgi:hypothetical protein